MIYPDLSTNTKKLLLLCLSALLVFCLLFLPATCSASGTQEADQEPELMYQITEQELVQLESNLTKLQQLSATQQAELIRLRDQLKKSEQELQLLKNQLSTSSVQLTTARQSLQIANQSLQKYAQGEKRERLRIKAQRNTWEVVCCGLIVALIKK